MRRAARATTAARSLLLGALWPLVSACDASSVEAVDTPEYRERWSEDDEPSLFGESFTRKFDELPNYGYVDRIPWPGSYWPTYRDNINYRWAGPSSRSPAEKYEQAFGKSGVEDAVSRVFGVDSLDARSCRKDSECAEGSLCARRRGEELGRCSERWFGICDGWAAASLLEDEPQRAVEYNGVRFEIPDLKALVSLQYTAGVSYRQLSLRCNESGAEHDLGDVQACKDTNPGTFHVVVTNMIGLRGEPFIMDRSYDRDVWNHPIVGYRILRSRQVSPAAANDLLGAAGQGYAFNPDAAELRQMRMLVGWVAASTPEADGTLIDLIDSFTLTYTYDYILELDHDGRVIGGEWLGASRRQHPDFLWLPVKKEESTVAGIKHRDVKKLLSLAGGE